MTYTGKDYAEAASHKTDWATCANMRYAMFGALKEWNALPAEQKTAEHARALLVAAPLKDAVLQAAGTAEVVSAYYKEIAGHTSNTNMVGFLNSVKPEDIKGIADGLEHHAYKAMLSAASNFSAAGKKYLHIETLTDSYQNFLKSHANELGAIAIQPKPFTAVQVDHLKADQNLFNLLDGMDDKLSYVGLGSPGVAHKMVDFNTDKEAYVEPVLAAIQKLRSGKVEDIQPALKAINQTIGPAERDLADIGSIKTTAQAQKIADMLSTSIMKMRTESNHGVDVSAVWRVAIEDAKTMKETPKFPVQDAGDIAAPHHHSAKQTQKAVQSH